MKRARAFIVGLTILAVTSPAYAGDLRDSAARAARQQAQTQPAVSRGTGNPLVWPGAGLVAAGMGMTLWGLLYTSDGKYVTTSDVSKTSSPKMVGAGMALVGAGGALLFWGSQRSKHMPSVMVGAQSVGVAKVLSW
jgi:hypothetical protein